jgi:hypothetical protein
MALNFIVATVVSRLGSAPPKEVQDLIEEIRFPGNPLA